MKEWNVIVAEPAESDIDGVYNYIANTLFEPVTAWRQTERIREAVSSLEEMPERGSLLQNEPWRSRGLRRLIVDNYSIIYEIQESSDTVAVVAVLYSKRNIDAVLSQEER